MIRPTVGRIVWFFPNTGEYMYEEPLPAMITKCWTDTCINVAVFKEDGNPMENPPTSVTLVQPEDDTSDTASGPYCTWMPYQVKK